MNGKARRQKQRAKARQARRTEFEGIAQAKLGKITKKNRDILAELVGQHIVANLGKFHAKNRLVRIIHDENGKGYAFAATRKTVDKRQSKLNCQVFPELGAVRLAGIRRGMFDAMQLSRYGFRFDSGVGCYAKLGEIDKQRLRFNANLAILLELLP